MPYSENKFLGTKIKSLTYVFTQRWVFFATRRCSIGYVIVEHLPLSKKSNICSDWVDITQLGVRKAEASKD